MQPSHAEPCVIDPTCEIRVGKSSWDDNQISIKYTWFNKNGQAARGGEVPIESVPQMLSYAIRTGYLDITKK